MALSGASDAGLAEPGICTALSLYQITVNLLNLRDLDSLRTMTEIGAMKLLSATRSNKPSTRQTRNSKRKAPLVRERLNRFAARNRHRPESDKA